MGDYVWNDANQNGIQDSNEAGVSGVTVELYHNANCTGTPIATTTTDANGRYLFTIPSGQYAVKFTLPNGYKFTIANQGSNDNQDSDADPNTGCAGPALVPQGGSDLSWDAGLVELASLGDYIWMDLNRDGVQNNNEPGIPNVTVKLYRGDCSGTPIATTTTDANGRYLFTDLAPDTYTLKFVLPDGYQFTIPHHGSNDEDSDADPNTGCTNAIDLHAGENNVTVDAGLIPYSALGNWVWNDANQNGIQDEGYEAGVSGVTVELYHNANCTGTPAKTVQTSEKGYYIFPNLNEGTYSIRFVLPNEYTFSPHMAPGSTASIDSNANPNNDGCTGSIHLATGVTDNTWDAGLYKEATPTPVPTPTVVPPTPTPTGDHIYLPIIITPGDKCEISRVNVVVWGQFFSFPVDNQIHVVPPLPWQTPTEFRLFNYTGDRTWYLYDPYYEKQSGGDAYVYGGGHPGDPFSLYLFTDCGFILITSHVDPPPLLTQEQLETIPFKESGQ